MTRSPRAWRWGRAAAVVVGFAALLAHLACVPFYAGGAIGGHTRWRLEHGRLTVARSANPHRITFFIDINHEPARWWPDGRWESPSTWEIAAPMWMVWAPALVIAWGPTAARLARARRGRVGRAADGNA